MQTLSGRGEPVLAEAPAEESKLWAPSGLFPTAEDLAHQRRNHPDEPVLSRREFECRRMDQLEIRPGQRCC